MMKKVPKRRFKGFLNAGDWEQCKFKDIAFKRGKISEADLPYVEFEDINSGIGTLNKNILQKVGHKKGILFEAGDVLFGKLRPYLQNWLLCQFMGIAVGDFWVFQPQIVSSAFLYYLIQSEAYQSVVNISSRTKMPRSSWSLVSETHFSIPKYKEATMIGEFLTSIDKNITLHQRKLKKLQATKKALLYELFPIENSRRPKRRFKGFTGDWEQRKLGELVTVFSGQDYKHLSEGDIPVYGTGGYMLSVNEALSNDQDAIGIGRKGTIDKPYILKAPFWTVDTLFYAIPKEKMDLNFIFCIFKNVDWRKLDESTGVPSLSKSTITNVDVYCPFFEEQLLIGRFFSWIDSSITLHQRKLEKLKNLKAAYLNEMFV